MLRGCFQSAYRHFYSTETALLKVHHDIAETMGRKSASVLVMLYLSATFDAIDHQLLFSRLEHTFGITANSLRWIKSYLCNRRQCVNVGGVHLQKNV